MVIVAEVKADYAITRERHLKHKSDTVRLSLNEARAHKFAIDWSSYTPPVPKQPGVHVLKPSDLQKLVDVIDWTPFFASWNCTENFRRFSTMKSSAPKRRNSMLMRSAMLKKMVAENWWKRAPCSDYSRPIASTTTTSRSTLTNRAAKS